MTELLKTLQTYPKTWEKFVWYMMENFGITEKDLLNPINDTPAEKTMVQIALDGFLTSFCDGEGYYVFPNKECNLFYYKIKRQNLSPIIFESECVYLSRQEAFNAGMVKSFSLMEEKEK
jgi:hypothetical protein